MADPDAPDDGRRYAGQSRLERRAARRARLVEGGLELFGTEGYAGASIERLCARAGVSTRYFYEVFESREALLQEVYDEVVATAVDHLRRAAAGRAGDSPRQRVETALRAYVEHVTEDRRRAVVVHREARRTGRIEHHRSDVVTRATAEVRRALALDRGPPRPEQELLDRAIAGAVAETMAAWLAADQPPSVDELVTALVRVIWPAAGPDTDD